jgi:hypothetical protein
MHDTKRKTTMVEMDGVPYFVLRQDDGTAKALFTVPSSMTELLMKHPIACRGGFFELRIDTASRNLQSASQHQQFAGTTFLSTEFYSPQPEETACAISTRLARRMADTDPLDMSGVLGLPRK